MNECTSARGGVASIDAAGKPPEILYARSTMLLSSHECMWAPG